MVSVLKLAPLFALLATPAVAATCPTYSGNVPWSMVAKPCGPVRSDSTGAIVNVPISSTPNFQLTGGAAIRGAPVNVGGAHVDSFLFSDTTPATAANSTWSHIFQMTSSTGYGDTDPVSGANTSRINLYSGISCLSGSASCWANYWTLYAGAGFEGAGTGLQLNLGNDASDRDPSVSGTSIIRGLHVTGSPQYPTSYGVDIMNSGAANATSGNIYVSHDAFVVGQGGAKDNSFFDTGTANESLHIMGTHSLGLDLVYATISSSAILLDSSQAVDFYNKTGPLAYHGLSSDGSTTILGAASPSNDIGYGGSGGYSFLNVSNNSTSATTLAAVGNSTNIDLALSAKGTGLIKPASGISGVQTLASSGTNALTTNPVGIGSRTVKSSLYLNDVADQDATTSIWPHIIQTTSSTGYGNTDPIWGGAADRINLFVGMQCLAGSSDCWAENQMLYVGAGFKGHGHGSEIDVENDSSDRDPNVAGTASINGLEVTGLTQYPVSYAIDVVGGGTNSTSGNAYVAHDGIGFLGGGAKDNSIIDVGSATYSYTLSGTHTVGISTAAATLSSKNALLLGKSHQIGFWDPTTSTTLQGLSMDGGGDAVVVGANMPQVLLGYGGSDGSYSFLGFTDQYTDHTAIFAVGNATNVDIDLQPKGTGAVKVATSLSAPTVTASTSLVVPVASAAPTGTCTSGQITVTSTAMYVCIATAWKTATLN